MAAGIPIRTRSTQIVISHFHPDHINGIKDKDNRLIFPNAEIMVPAPEWAFWMDDANLNAAPADLKPTFLNQRRIFADIKNQVTQFPAGPGGRARHRHFAARRATPPAIRFLPFIPATSRYWCSATPHSIPRCSRAIPTGRPPSTSTVPGRWRRARKFFDRAAADRMLITGYHFPFPACGHLIKTATGYEHVPIEWQPNCNAAQFSFAPALTKLARHRRAKPHSVLRYSTSCQRCSSVILSVP